jgi:crotonobetainyl-CoA:carnitine CoA-transferase CaiB-like acyl-CoA transferase
MTGMGQGALTGVRVIDLTRMLSGPFCTMMLADHGAEVIKIEPPDGDTTRNQVKGPYFPDDELREYGGYFQSVNRNKHGIVIDLKQPQGQALVRRLVARADVLVENFRAGTMERLDLGYESLRAINPRLVYAAIRGFGDPRTGASPYVDWPAYDVVAQAMGGIMGITGPDQSTPIKVGPGMGDIVPALYAAFAIVAGVRHAERSGEGQFLDVAMYDAVLAVCERIVYQHAYSDLVPAPEGNAHPFMAPFGLFPAQDGWVAIAAPTDMFWREICVTIGKVDWLTDARFVDRMTRGRYKDTINAAVADWTRPRSKRELSALLGGRLPFGPVHNVADIFADPHVRIRGMLAEVEHPGSGRRAIIANTPVRFTATPGGVRRRAPRFGEHTDVTLRSLGVGDDEIAELRRSGTVR